MLAARIRRRHLWQIATRRREDLGNVHCVSRANHEMGRQCATSDTWAGSFALRLAGNGRVRW